MIINGGGVGDQEIGFYWKQRLFYCIFFILFENRNKSLGNWLIIPHHVFLKSILTCFFHAYLSLVILSKKWRPGLEIWLSAGDKKSSKYIRKKHVMWYNRPVLSLVSDMILLSYHGNLCNILYQVKSCFPVFCLVTTQPSPLPKFKKIKWRFSISSPSSNPADTYTNHSSQMISLLNLT